MFTLLMVSMQLVLELDDDMLLDIGFHDASSRDLLLTPECEALFFSTILRLSNKLLVRPWPRTTSTSIMLTTWRPPVHYHGSKSFTPSPPDHMYIAMPCSLPALCPQTPSVKLLRYTQTALQLSSLLVYSRTSIRWCLQRLYTKSIKQGIGHN